MTVKQSQSVTSESAVQTFVQAYKTDGRTDAQAQAHALRALLLSVDSDARNDALFARKWNADRTECTYNVAGLIVRTFQTKSGQWKYTMQDIVARDMSGNAVRFASRETNSVSDSEEKCAQNAFASLRNGILHIIRTRETRVTIRSTDAQEFVERAMRAERETEALRKRAEELERKIAELSAQK